MKILIAGAPKTGNMWLKSILGHLYKIPQVDLSGAPDFRAYLNQNFQTFVTHQHFLPKPYIVAWVKQENVRVLTMARHPGDLFLSLYYYVNKFAEKWREKGTLGSTASHQLIGKNLDHEAVFRYLEQDFHAECLGKTLAWVNAGHAFDLRYEDLNAKPFTTVKSLVSQLEPARSWNLWRALQKSRFRVMQKKAGPEMKAHFRNGKTGGWKAVLNPKHIDILEEVSAPAMKRWGYSFRSSSHQNRTAL